MAHILIIDDDPGVRGVLKAMLERAGYDVAAGGGGVEGLKLAHARRPDLVLLDIEMPGMNGFDVCSLIKTDTALASVPVVIMTGRPIAGVPARAQAVGAVDLLAKPFERDSLLRKVGAYLAGGVAGR
ncbi:two-component system response regulator [Nibricoccus aquaticus]|uniref:Two-component system response regulator n=1 Tax=Nibricoccus aquaticus TaxID=2576891 RepID=A0A290Q470_9BACT|nr:response regulator [Nibricoccus aquaticus]ATC63465.1 two-component system response regulator [Nibricoccus aquaticus]